VDHSRRRRLVAAGAGVVVLLLLLGGTWAGVQVDDRLRTAREDDARAVVAAVSRGDCPAAAAAYRGATTGRMLPGRTRPPVADDVTRAATDCRDLSRVDALAASGRHVEAIRGYLEFRRSHVFSPLYGRVDDRVASVLRTAHPVPDAETCRLVARVSGVADDPPTSADTVPGLFTACGEVLARTGVTDDDDMWGALGLLSTVRERFGSSPEARRAEVAQAALLVATPGNRKFLRSPERIRAGSGRARLTFWNHTRATMTFAISGPGGGRVVEVPACAACPVAENGHYVRCVDGKGRAAVVTLPAATYQVRIIFGGDRHHEWTGTWRLSGGTWEDCLVEAPPD
jgi:hypothetical protein